MLVDFHASERVGDCVQVVLVHFDHRLDAASEFILELVLRVEDAAALRRDEGLVVDVLSQ